jgi:hypothetical protein
LSATSEAADARFRTYEKQAKGFEARFKALEAKFEAMQSELLVVKDLLQAQQETIKQSLARQFPAGNEWDGAFIVSKCVHICIFNTDFSPLLSQAAIRKAMLSAMEIDSTSELPDPDPNGRVLVPHPTVEGTFIMRPNFEASWTSNNGWKAFFVKYFRARGHSCHTALPEEVVRDIITDDEILHQTKTAFSNMKVQYKDKHRGKGAEERKRKNSRRNQRKKKVRFFLCVSMNSSSYSSRKPRSDNLQQFELSSTFPSLTSCLIPSISLMMRLMTRTHSQMGKLVTPHLPSLSRGVASIYPALMDIDQQK